MGAIYEEVTGKLDNWTATMPHNGEMLFWGDIDGDRHGRWLNGTRIHTSGVPEGDYNEGDIITTRNSTYLLGKELVVPDNMVEGCETCE